MSWEEGGSFLTLLYWDSDYIRTVFSLCCSACVHVVAVFAVPWLSLALSSHLKYVSSLCVPSVMFPWCFKSQVLYVLSQEAPEKAKITKE